MNKTKLKSHLSNDELKDRMLNTKDRAQFQRWQAIYLLDMGLKANKVSECVATSFFS